MSFSAYSKRYITNSGFSLMEPTLRNGFFAGVVLLLFTGPLPAQEIMSYEQYQRFEHKEPYIIRLQSHAGTLLYFGSRHSFDPDDPQMDTLSRVFSDFSPDVVYTEAFPEQIDSLSRPEAIKRSGEFGLTWKLAGENDIPVYSLEPDRADEVAYLQMQIWSDTQIVLFYTLRQVAQSHQQQLSMDLSIVVPKYLTSLNQRFGLTGPTTIEEFEQAVNRLLPGVDNWQTIPGSYFYPGPQDPEYFTNRIATDSNIFRDRHHVNMITEAVQEGKKVFAVAGSTHAVMQEPALRSILDTK